MLTAIVLAALLPAGMLQWIIIAIVLITAVAILYAVANHFKFTIPPVLVFIFWAVVIAAAAILAIKLLAGL